jgi:hypothetical protein
VVVSETAALSGSRVFHFEKRYSPMAAVASIRLMKIKKSYKVTVNIILRYGIHY